MPEKEGAEEKTTKSVVNKKQKQMMGEEGYDHLRDQGRIRKNKKKKDATSYPPSDEVKKTQKKNKGPSALEIVKKKYEGQIMDVKKEELDLTKVAESFGGYIVEEIKDADQAANISKARRKLTTKGDAVKPAEVQGRQDATDPKQGGYSRVDDKFDAPKGKTKLPTDPSQVGKAGPVKTIKPAKFSSTKGGLKGNILTPGPENAARSAAETLRRKDQQKQGRINRKKETPVTTSSKVKKPIKGGSLANVKTYKKTGGKLVNTTPPTPTRTDVRRAFMHSQKDKLESQKKAKAMQKKLGVELKGKKGKFPSGQGTFDLGDTTTTGDPISTKKKRALKGTTVIGTPKQSGGRQLRIGGLTKQGKRSADKLTAKGLERVKKQVAKDAARETAEKAAKSVAVKQAKKSIARGAAKTVVKKAAAKGAAKFALKRIPGIGAAISGAEAIGRAAKGDFVGAGIAAGEGILSSIPGVGTVASGALGAVGATRDARRALKVGSKLKRTARSAYKTAMRAKTTKGKAFKTAGGVATGFKGSPKKFGVDTTSKLKRAKDFLFKDLPGTGTKKTRTKDLILGKTRFGRGARVQLAQDKIRKVIGGAAKKTGADVGVVGRRSAGGFTAS